MASDDFNLSPESKKMLFRLSMDESHCSRSLIFDRMIFLCWEIKEKAWKSLMSLFFGKISAKASPTNTLAALRKRKKQFPNTNVCGWCETKKPNRRAFHLMNEIRLRERKSERIARRWESREARKALSRGSAPRSFSLNNSWNWKYLQWLKLTIYLSIRNNKNKRDVRHDYGSDVKCDRDNSRNQRDENSPDAHVRLQLFGTLRPEVVNLMSPTWRQTSIVPR